MLFDLMLYRYPVLVKRVFELLIMYFTRERTVIESLCSIQLLETEKGKETLESIKKHSQTLEKEVADWTSWLTKNKKQGDKVKDLVAKIF
jgi:hypothetical protein